MTWTKKSDGWYQLDLLRAKKRLYGLLLKKPVDKITDNELNIMSRLSEDKDIQEDLQKFIDDQTKKEL